MRIFEKFIADNFYITFWEKKNVLENSLHWLFLYIKSLFLEDLIIKFYEFFFNV